MKQFLFFCLLAAIVTACQKSDIELLPGEWRITRIRPSGELSQKARADYTLRFRIDGVYSLNLDVNNCGGPFLSDGIDRLDFGGVACTEICCDSPFAERMTGILNSVSNFRINGRTLTMIGTAGTAEARWVKN
jgi:heat shock protein HslJ